MALLVFLSVLLGYATRAVWYVGLFPRAEADMAGGVEALRASRWRTNAVLVLALTMIAAGLGTLILHRPFLAFADVLRFSLKIWLSILVPALFVGWSWTKGSLAALVALIGYWMVVVLELTILARILL